MKFDMAAPCESCPFKRGTTMAASLSDDRWNSLVREVGFENKTFTCHKTVRYDLEELDEDGEEVGYGKDGGEQHCAGALLWLKQGGLVNGMVQIAERLGLYDSSGIDTSIDCGPPKGIHIPTNWRQ